MASGIYERFKANLMDKEVDLGGGGDTITVALMDNSHGFTATHNTWAEVSENELEETGGYVAKTLGSQTVTQAAATKFDGANVVWTEATFTAYHAVLYDNTLDNDDLICSIDFGGAKSVSGGTFTIEWDAAGIITLT